MVKSPFDVAVTSCEADKGVIPDIHCDQAGGLPALVGAAPHLPRGLTSTPIRRSPSPMVLAPVLLSLAAPRAEEMT